jgi:IclR family transcriptional regulator, mhp operon transcriptional activator
MRSGPKATTRQYKEVRGLARGLDVLKALNRVPGGIGSTTELARACSLDRTTTKRLLETLRSQGFVRQGERDGQYYLTFEVRRLSEGFEDETWVGQVATPLMHAAVRELVWPCDLGTAEAGFMVVRESTHRWSPLSQHRAMIGERMPVLVTALGRAYLAACEEVEREGLLELLRRRDDWIGEQARDKAYVARTLRDTVRRGYGYNDGEWLREASFAAIAVPVMAGDRVLAAVNLVFPKAAVSKNDLESRFLPALKRLASAIGKSSRALVEA